MNKKLIGILISTLMLISLPSVTGDLNTNEKNSSIEIFETDWWPQFQHDDMNTGFSTSPPALNNITRWNTSLDDTAYYSSPIVYEGLVYIGTAGGYLYCFNADSGDLVWSNTTSSSLQFCSASAYDEMIYVVDTNGNVYCYGAYTGEKIWENSTAYNTRASPKIYDGNVYVASYDQGMFCFDAYTGTKLWQNTAVGLVRFSTPAIYNNRIYVGSLDTKIYCLYANNGTINWSKTTIGAIWNPPSIYDGKVYSISQENYYSTYIYCYDTYSGTQIFRKNTGSAVNIVSSPAFGNNEIFIHAQNIIKCLNSTTGNTKWSKTIGSSASGSSPAVVDNYLYAGFDDGQVVCLDTNNSGTVIWTFNTGSGGVVHSSPAIVDGSVYICDGSAPGDPGEIYRICLPNDPPDVPQKPDGPNSGTTEEEYTFSTQSTDPENNSIYYKWDWGDGNVSEWLGPYDSGAIATASYIWNISGDFQIRVQATDGNSLPTGEWSPDHCIHIDQNYAPDTPEEPRGPDYGGFGDEYDEYTFCVDGVNDSNGHDVFYMFDWGDGENTTWLGPYQSGVDEVCASHSWEDIGIYNIRVKVKDELGRINEIWSENHILEIVYPELASIGGEEGLFRANVILRNIGHIPIYNINWKFEVEGGLLGFISNEINGTIAVIEPGDDVVIKSRFTIGIGLIALTISTDAYNFDDTITIIPAKIFLFKISTLDNLNYLGGE